MTSADPHLLDPDHLPTPFTADEIRIGCQPGRMIRALVEQQGASPLIHVTRFTSADADGAEQEAWDETVDGVPLGEPKVRRSRWLDFQGHASFPASTTEVTEESIEIPAGRFDCLVYTQRDGGSIQRFWFARSLPGMPIRFEERDGALMTWARGRLERRSQDVGTWPSRTAYSGRGW